MRGHQKTFLLLFFIGGLYFSESRPALADTVTILNGDRISGRVVRMEQGNLTLETDFSQPIVIDRGKIRGIATDAQVEVTLQSGERLKGRLTTDSVGRLTVDGGGDRDEVRTLLEQVTAINPAPPRPVTLTGSITVGAVMESGNTDRSSASLALDATRKDPRHRFSLEFRFNYAEEDGDLTTRNTFGAFKYDYFFTPRIYGYLGVEMLKDEFKDLNLRTAIGPGAGYQFWDEEKTALGLEGGLAYFNEDREVGEDDHWVTGRLAGNFRYRLLDRIDFTEKLVLYPSLEDIGKFTLRNEASLSTPIAFGWALRLANLIDHDSDPDTPGVKKTDIALVLGLQYGF